MQAERVRDMVLTCSVEWTLGTVRQTAGRVFVDFRAISAWVLATWIWHLQSRVQISALSHSAEAV